jgi:hypothetical protein
MSFAAPFVGAFTSNKHVLRTRGKALSLKMKRARKRQPVGLLLPPLAVVAFKL